MKKEWDIGLGFAGTKSQNTYSNATLLHRHRNHKMSSYTYTIIHENTESSFDITDIRGKQFRCLIFLQIELEKHKV